MRMKFSVWGPPLAEKPAAGWALEANDIAADGTATLRLRAHGAAPACSTHGTAHPHVPPRHTRVTHGYVRYPQTGYVYHFS